MAGVKHDSATDVENLKKILTSYKEGFAFIKELIQNADDAEDASVVKMFWHRGLPEAKHELIKTPALLVLNDGSFDITHKDGLMRMGMGSKAGDVESIGRFGLGMKSVFHVCEGFFFLEHSGDDKLRELFCPWHPDSHDKWDTVEADDWDLLEKEIVRSLELPATDKWFALWIPLRRESHCKNPDKQIIRGDLAFPGESKDQCPKSLIVPFQEKSPRLAESLIFLKNVKKITFPDFEEITHDQENQKITPSVSYYRRKAEEKVEKAKEWQSKPNWPKVLSGGKEDPDKAKWDAAAAVSINRDKLSKGHLRIFWSVFLPVGNEPYQCLEVENLPFDLHLFLHGYFFTNDARTEVLGVANQFGNANESDESCIREAWNKELATDKDGLLPLIIPVFEEAFEKETFNDEQIHTIVKALSESKLFKDYHKTIAADIRFGRFLINGVWKWQSLKVDQEVVLMPGSPSLQLETLERMMAKWFSSEDKLMFCLKGSPALDNGSKSFEWSANTANSIYTRLCEYSCEFSPKERIYLRTLVSKIEKQITPQTNWKKLRIYEVHNIHTAESEIVNATFFEEKIEANAIYHGNLSNDRDLIESFSKACPESKIWISPEESPPNMDIEVISVEHIASIVNRSDVFGVVADRKELLHIFLESDREKVVIQAIRSLLLGKSLSTAASDEALYFNDGVWEAPVQILLRKLGRENGMVDSIFESEINDNQKKEINILSTNGDVFCQLLNKVGTEEQLEGIGLEEHSELFLNNLQQSEEQLKTLRSLPIYCYGEGLYTSATDKVWLAPKENLIDKNPEQWEKLRSSAKIVARSEDGSIALAQEKIFEEQILDRDGIIRLASEEESPSQYIKIILECLSKGTPSSEALKSLRETEWIPLRNAPSCKIEQIVWIKEAEDELTKVIEKLPQDKGYVLKNQIAIDWDSDDESMAWRAKAWNTIATPSSNLIPSENRLICFLKPGIEESSELHFGIDLHQETTISQWLESVQDIEPDFSDAIYLIRKIFAPCGNDTNSIKPWCLDLAKLFFRVWKGEDLVRYDNALEALKQRHQETNISSKVKKSIETSFYHYLKLAKEKGRWDTTYVKDETFELLNLHEKWVTIDKLTLSVEGVTESSIVAEKAEEALSLKKSSAVGSVEPPHQSVEVGKNEELRKLLEDYADNMREKLNRSHWGVFLSLLGPNVRELASEFLDPMDVDSLRINLVGKDRCDARIRLVCRQYTCEIVSGVTVQIQALHGNQFDASREDEGASLLVPMANKDEGNCHFKINDEKLPYEVTFKLLDPNILEGEDSNKVRERLEKTIQLLQQEVLRIDDSVILSATERILNKVQGLDSQGLSLAQQIILGNSQMHMQQLSYKPAENTGLAEALELLEKSSSQKAEARTEEDTNIGDWVKKKDDSQINEKKALEEIRKQLTENEEVQSGLVKAMDEKITQEQYKADSVPFEIFQNADDALNQMGDSTEVPDCFIADFKDNEVRFAHWGRPINTPVGDDSETTDSHKKDLSKMLILHGSDKSPSAEGQVTGKFGLGFKSVYLISKRPETLSANLGFEVLGAMFPQRISEARRGDLKGWLDELKPNSKDGTAIRLPLKENVNPGFSKRFEELSPFLPIFAKRIREIKMKEGKVSHHWKPQQVAEAENGAWKVFSGNITLTNEGDFEVLHLVGENVSWLFGGNLEKLKKIADIPCFWITAPTLTQDNFGFAINSSRFETDPGRTQLSNTGRKNNEVLLREAATVLFEFLESQLTEETNDKKTFWQSVWELFTKPSEASTESPIFTAILENGAGYRKLVEDSEVVPNGLSDTASCLTSLSNINFHTDGFLDSKKGRELINALFESETLTAKLTEKRIASNCIVSRKIASKLKSHFRISSVIEALNLASLLNKLFENDGNVSAEDASILGKHLSKSKLFPENGNDDSYNWNTAEKQGLKDALAKLKFKNSADSWTNAKELLTTKGVDFEENRAGFTTPARLLENSYNENPKSLGFFKLCRDEMKVSVEELAECLIEAFENGDSRRKQSALKFLSSEDPLKVPTAKNMSEVTWRTIIDSVEFKELDLVKQNQVKNCKSAVKLSQANDEGRIYDINQPNESIDPIKEITADDLLECWNKDGAKEVALERFTLSGSLGKCVVPSDPTDDKITALLKNPATAAGREAWYRFLCLGCSLSLPLGRNSTNRVSDLWKNNLGESFWEKTCPNSLEEVKTEDFNKNLESKFSSIIHELHKDSSATGEDAMFWRRVFYDFRKFHFLVYKNHLAETILEFANSKDAEGVGLIEFLRSGKVPDNMQSADTPQFAGVIGQSMTAPLLFIMRELRRLDVIDRRFDSACYFMNSPARKTSAKLGWIENNSQETGDFGKLVEMSEQIDKKMKEIKDFKGCFDLPLQLYAIESND